MKSSLILAFLALLITGCSKSVDGISSNVESTSRTNSTEQKTGTEIRLMKLEDRLKAEAHRLKAGIGSETEFITSFNQYLETANDLQVVAEEASSLQRELISIFDNRLNLYLNLLNSSLEGRSGSIKIEIKNDDPKSAYNALNSLYMSLASRKLRSKLTLADQYLVFDITILLKEKFATQNQETVPETKIADFLKAMINDNKKTPQETFFAYQIAHRLLRSDYALFSAFFPVISKVKLSEKSNYNEIELYKRLSSFAVSGKYTSFINSAEEVETYFNNINFISTNAIDKINTHGIDEIKGYFESLDLAFNVHTAFLGMIADSNRLSIREISKVQDKFIESTYSSFLKSLNEKSDLYLAFSRRQCNNFLSKELELILESFLLDIDKKQETNCVVSLREKFRKNDNSYLTDLQTLVDKENAKLRDIGDQNIREYFEQYNLAVMNNWILNIVAKNTSKSDLSSSDLQVKLYGIYQTTKRSLINVLKLRELNEISQIDELQSEESELYLKAGKYRGIINTNKTLFLHPLAVIVSENNSPIEINSEKIIGGRVDANFISKNYNIVTNAHLNQTVFKGTQPLQNPASQVILSQKTYRERCNNPGKNGGDGGGCADALSGTKYVYRVTKDAAEGRTPDQGFIGEKGINAKVVTLALKRRNLFETTILSFGEQGFKGNQGLNSPRCNQANEYQVFYGRYYSFNCNEDTGVGSNNCPQLSAAHESSAAYLREIISHAGKSGDGGEGGNGGNITIHTSDSLVAYPGLSIGGIGGGAGVAAACRHPGQNSELIGEVGKLGTNGKVEIVK